MKRQPANSNAKLKPSSVRPAVPGADPAVVLRLADRVLLGELVQSATVEEGCAILALLAQRGLHIVRSGWPNAGAFRITVAPTTAPSPVGATAETGEGRDGGRGGGSGDQP